VKSEVEQNIKKAKMREAERMRDDLEKKLKQVTETITEIADEPTVP
jgi:F0F1-type ATP synthase membrane subunit b/b'